MNRLGRAFERWILFVLAAVLWEVLARRAGSFFFPPLSVILVRTYEVWIASIWVDGWEASALRRDLLPSLGRAAAGLSLAIVLGIGGGLAIGSSRRTAALFEPVVHYLRGMPPVAIIPIFIIVLGIGAQMRIAVIAFGCAWPILLNTIHGVRAVDPVQLDTATVFGVSRRERLARVVVPAASPSVFAGLRISASVALILMIVSEMVAGGLGGIGEVIMLAQRNFRVADMWAGIIVVGGLGYGINRSLASVEDRALAWHRRSMAGGAT